MARWFNFPEDTNINSFISTHGSDQLTSDPTHILLPALSLCMDLIFTGEPNLRGW